MFNSLGKRQTTASFRFEGADTRSLAFDRIPASENCRASLTSSFTRDGKRQQGEGAQANVPALAGYPRAQHPRPRPNGYNLKEQPLDPTNCIACIPFVPWMGEP